LFVDNATSHVDLNKSNVAIRFLTPNLTSEVQPLDKGMIQPMKLQYRKQLMREFINAADKCNSVAEFTRSVTVLDAIRWVHGAWENVSPETTKKCFRHAGSVVSSTENKMRGVKNTTWMMR
jgi:predicted unusual protein kinase regulating ubiquinone biosynthesis (AarF/ABC1/UbiB family)